MGTCTSRSVYLSNEFLKDFKNIFLAHLDLVVPGGRERGRLTGTQIQRSNRFECFTAQWDDCGTTVHSNITSYRRSWRRAQLGSQHREDGLLPDLIGLCTCVGTWPCTPWKRIGTPCSSKTLLDNEWKQSVFHESLTSSSDYSKSFLSAKILIWVFLRPPPGGGMGNYWIHRGFCEPLKSGE